MKNFKTNKKYYIFFSGIILFWFLWPWITELWTSKLANLPANEFGDSFGSISALFTGLAFFGVVVSLYIQRQDFDESIKEMRTQNKLTKSQMQLNLFPTVFKQKLEDLNNVLSELEGEENLKDLTLQTVSNQKIKKWLAATNAKQEDIVSNINQVTIAYTISKKFENKKIELRKEKNDSEIRLEKYKKENAENQLESKDISIEKENLLEKIQDADNNLKNIMKELGLAAQNEANYYHGEDKRSVEFADTSIVSKYLDDDEVVEINKNSLKNCLGESEKENDYSQSFYGEVRGYVKDLGLLKKKYEDVADEILRIKELRDIFNKWQKKQKQILDSLLN